MTDDELTIMRRLAAGPLRIDDLDDDESDVVDGLAARDLVEFRPAHADVCLTDLGRRLFAAVESSR